MVTIRDAQVVDFDEINGYFSKARQNTAFAHIAPCQNKMRRVYVTAIEFEDGYAKVVEKNGNVCGGLVGMVAENHFGLRIAQDLFMYADYGTHLLLKDFKQWAHQRRADATLITDSSNNPRYQKLIQRLGFQPAGVNYIEVK